MLRSCLRPAASCSALFLLLHLQGCGPKTTSVVQARLESIEFTSDHGQLRDNRENWQDNNSLYSKPEWHKDNGTNNPATHTMAEAVSLKVGVKVKPAGASFDLFGEIPDEEPCFSFTKTGEQATGSGQDVTATAAESLPLCMHRCNESISWNVSVAGRSISLGSSGPHKVYVTYGTPTDSEVTEKRLDWVFNAVGVASSLHTIADNVYDELNSHEPPYLDARNPSTPNPLWLLMKPETNGVRLWRGECEDLAELMCRAVQIVGGTAECKYVYGSTDDDCVSDVQDAHEPRNCPIHGQEKLRVWSDQRWNQWEGVCVVQGKHYALHLPIPGGGSLEAAGTGVEVLRKWLSLPLTYQAWTYEDSGGNYVVCESEDAP